MGYEEDKVTGIYSQDFFYDPVKCKPVYQLSDNPVWYGRVKGMKRENQHLLVYGFVPLNEEYPHNLLNEEFKIKYEVNIRAKNHGQHDWVYMEETTNTIETKCVEGHDLCAYWPVAYVPYMEYEMYDVGIELKLDEEFTEASGVHIDFHIAYFNPAYTK